MEMELGHSSPNSEFGITLGKKKKLRVIFEVLMRLGKKMMEVLR